MTPENIPNQTTTTTLAPPVGNCYPNVTVNSPLTVTPVTAIDSVAVQASFPPSSEVIDNVDLSQIFLAWPRF